MILIFLTFGWRRRKLRATRLSPSLHGLDRCSNPRWAPCAKAPGGMSANITAPQADLDDISAWDYHTTLPQDTVFERVRDSLKLLLVPKKTTRPETLHQDLNISGFHHQSPTVGAQGGCSQEMSGVVGVPFALALPPLCHIAGALDSASSSRPAIVAQGDTND